jgi:hypothetical protein
MIAPTAVGSSRPEAIHDCRPRASLVDTDVLILIDALDPDELPAEIVINSMTMAELAAGPHFMTDPASAPDESNEFKTRRRCSSRCRSILAQHAVTARSSRRCSRPGEIRSRAGSI